MKDDTELLSAQRRASNETEGEGQVLADGFAGLTPIIVRRGNAIGLEFHVVDIKTKLILDLDKIQLCWRSL